MALGNQLLSDIVLYDKYARWREDLQRRETWPEVVERVVTFFQSLPIEAHVRAHEWAALKDAMLQKEVLPSMRVVQMAGPPLARCHVGAYNCAYTVLDSPTALAELLYILMQGTGVGYSVEQRYINQWPRVEPAVTDASPHAIRVEDTTEGWCDALKTVLTMSLMGIPVTVDYSAIRPAGAWLHTKGGTASGPEPLKTLLDATVQIVRARAKTRLTSLDVHRLATLCGSIVQVGGVRRAAEIALFDATDRTMRTCKDGAFWTTMPELAMANNSMVLTGPVDTERLDQFVRQLSTTGSGEPGLFRRDGAIPTRRVERDDFGTNPCGEIILRPHQFCNLSIAVARPDDTPDALRAKVTLAALWGTLQSCLTTFGYLRDDWQRNSEEERLLGVDITGAVDCPLLTDPDTTPALLDDLRRVAVDVNAAYARRLGIPASAAVTCNKPSGNSSQLLDSSSGIHARYAPYYIRRIRLAGGSPLSRRLRTLGLPCFPEVGQGPALEDAAVWVFELPVQAPPDSVTRDDLTAADQLAYWLLWKQHWTEHNPSCTIYVRPHEWDDVRAFLQTHWTAIGGLSFLPKDDHTYTLAPYETITEDEYQRRVATLPASLALDTLIESKDLTTVNQEYACVGGLCEL